MKLPVVIGFCLFLPISALAAPGDILFQDNGNGSMLSYWQGSSNCVDTNITSLTYTPDGGIHIDGVPFQGLAPEWSIIDTSNTEEGMTWNLSFFFDDTGEFFAYNQGIGIGLSTTLNWEQEPYGPEAQVPGAWAAFELNQCSQQQDHYGIGSHSCSQDYTIRRKGLRYISLVWDTSRANNNLIISIDGSPVLFGSAQKPPSPIRYLYLDGVSKPYTLYNLTLCDTYCDTTQAPRSLEQPLLNKTTCTPLNNGYRTPTQEKKIRSSGGGKHAPLTTEELLIIKNRQIRKEVLKGNTTTISNSTTTIQPLPVTSALPTYAEVEGEEGVGANSSSPPTQERFIAPTPYPTTGFWDFVRWVIQW